MFLSYTHNLKIILYSIFQNFYTHNSFIVWNFILVAIMLASDFLLQNILNFTFSD